MSYPPSQPPIPPGMAPPMMPPGYGFPPMGMMPMMGMIPSMMRTTTPSSTATTTATTVAKPSKKLIPQEIPKESDEKPPVTTVFVGNISERAPDAMIRQMLQRCGNVLSWKRVQGASGKLQAFGFCEYESPEATLCCIRLLNDWKIVDKNLLVKVDAKTKTLLEEYKKKKAVKKAKEAAAKKAEAAEEGEETSKENGDGNGLDEFTLREDRVAKAGLDAIMREYADELTKEPPPDLSAEEKKEKRKDKVPAKKDDAKEGIDEMDLAEEERDLINREINKFRDAHKDEDEKEPDRTRDRERRKREEEKERERRERERERREREREQERREWEAREREKERDREKYRSRTRSRSRSRETSYKERVDRVDRSERSERSERNDRTDRSERNERGDRNERNEKERDYEDEEEMYERKRMERKMREKEAAYQEKLKAWVARERKRMREYEKERDKEEDRKAEEAREARRLREFLEDYDDVRDDLKYYKGSALKKRLTEREKEMEADARDRQREKEEIEEIRRRLMDQGHPDVEIEMARIEREREEHLIPRLNKTPPRPSPEPEPVKQSPMKYVSQPPAAPPPPPQLPPPASVSSQGSLSDDDNNDADYDSYNIAASQSEDDNSQSFIGPSREDQQKDRLSFSGVKFGAAGSASQSPEQANASKRKKLTVGDVFNQDDEQTESSKKRRLVPIDYSEDSNGASNSSMSKPTTAEEKRKCIKNLIDRIPTAKPELFAYELDWSMVDTTLMDRRIKPWVNKKIVEYIGEEEPTLTDFICQKVMAHSPPQNILNDVSMVLDEEAEVFVVKMWRLLIYEIEAKKLGLVK